jgi:prevent-host-death family protein
LEVHLEQDPGIVPVSELRKDVAAVLKQLQSTQEPVVITQRGRAAAVLSSIEAYERREREHDLLQLLARGEKEISLGVGASLVSVLSEADDLLASD